MKRQMDLCHFPDSLGAQKADVCPKVSQQWCSTWFWPFNTGYVYVLRWCSIHPVIVSCTKCDTFVVCRFIFQIVLLRSGIIAFLQYRIEQDTGHLNVISVPNYVFSLPLCMHIPSRKCSVFMHMGSRTVLWRRWILWWRSSCLFLFVKWMHLLLI